MGRKLTIAVLSLVIPTVEVWADPPTRQVDRIQQASRDSDKQKILLAELNEQRGLLAELNQKKALAIQNDDKVEVTEVESRLEEVTDNINQLQQEINLAQKQDTAIQPVVLQPTARRQKQTPTLADNITIRNEQEAAIQQTGQWWDFYHRKK